MMPNKAQLFSQSVPVICLPLSHTVHLSQTCIFMHSNLSAAFICEAQREQIFMCIYTYNTEPPSTSKQSFPSKIQPMNKNVLLI